MDMFNSIQEAFKNGSGDVFFSKDGKYVCFSRHLDNTDQTITDGFTRLTYSEVISLTHNTDNHSVSNALIWVNAIKGRERELAKKIVKSYDSCYNGRDGYYDEFPDAYGQNL